MPFPELSGNLPLLPARIVNEYQYCPRLAYLEWVQGEWGESADTIQGRDAHQRVDRPTGNLPEADDADLRALNRDGIAPRPLAKGLVIAKIQNRRTLLRRNWKSGEAPADRCCERPVVLRLCLAGACLDDGAHGRGFRSLSRALSSAALWPAGIVTISRNSRIRFQARNCRGESAAAS